MTTLEPKTSTRRGTSLAAPMHELAAAAATDKPTLARTVRNAVRELDENTLRPVARRDAGVAFQPRTLLALVSYCYARDIYGSTDIEEVMRRDTNFRAFCQNEFPYAQTVAVFRRHNREAIRHCLVAALRFLANHTGLNGADSDVGEVQLVEEANRRILKAMFIDTMELDGH